MPILGHIVLFGVYDKKRLFLSYTPKIAYERISQTYDTGIFTENMLRGKIGVNAIESTKSLYDLVVVDSEGVEKHFAESLETENDVVIYTKLPRGFYISTPMGHYNPDWAVFFFPCFLMPLSLRSGA